MAQKPTIPKGTRDFSQAETARRGYIFDTCREVFRLFGYAPIETPAMENLSTLMGKYGEEGDKLLFKILNSGDFLKGISLPKSGDKSITASVSSDHESIDEITQNYGTLGNSNDSQRITPFISDKGLRYDLTVPFARYVVQHQNEIAFPFKRFQIQPVWRADRPQKGRYREFFQCDVDVIGSKSLVNELELIQIVQNVFSRLKIAVTLKLNNRKILAGIAESIGHADKLIDITIAIDKLEKVGLEAVKAELAEKGITREAIEKLQPILTLEGSTDEKLHRLAEILAGSETGLLGIEEMRYIFNMVSELRTTSSASAPATTTATAASIVPTAQPVSATIAQPIIARGEGAHAQSSGTLASAFPEASPTQCSGTLATPTSPEAAAPLDIELDLSLARGLNYYTGAIFEVKARDFAIGSICGGGRYDDLTGIFGMPGVSGVGISFGADRIYDVMSGLELFPEEAALGTRAMLLNFGGAEEVASLKLLADLRAHGIPAEIYPDPAKMKKQMEYADRRSIPFVVIVGEDELSKRVATVKNMASGEQRQVEFERISEILS